MSWYKYSGSSSNSLFVEILKWATCDKGRHLFWYRDKNGNKDICKVCGY